MDESWGIILAAGESRRLQGGKLLLPFGKSTVIEKVIETLKSSELNNVLVVTGAYREEMLQLEGVKSTNNCYNDRYKEGMLSSVICGLRYLPENVRYAVIMPADQPAIPAGVIDRMLEAARSSGKGILIPLFNGKRGHPLLFDTKYREEVEKLNPAGGLRLLPENHRDDLLEMETGEPGILRDIDTPADYEREIKLNL